MFIIIDKETKAFLMPGNELDYMENGYPRLVEENVAFPTWMVDVYELESIPEEVEPSKYCYTEKQGFYLNPNWVEPEADNIYGISDDIYRQILDDYTMALLEEGSLS